MNDAPLAPSVWRPEDLDRSAALRLPADVYDFVAGGADDELSLGRNRRAFEAHALVPRVFAGAGAPDCAAQVLGSRLAAPVLVAPMGMQRLVHPDGEAATAAAAAGAGLGFTVASGSSVALEEVARVAGDARWFQLYLLRDRGISRDLVERAVAAGYRAIVLTADVPVVGDRPRDRRSRFAPPPGVRNANFEPYAAVSAAHHAYVADLERHLAWPDLEWLVGVAGTTPVVVKGLLRADDARRALEHGARGIIVSNHGGRQLGRAPATLDVLPPVVDAVGGAAPVLLDGGVRTGVDVVTALGLGADAVLVGRLVMWALAVGGRETVTVVLRQLVDQVRRTMTLVGASKLPDLAGTVMRVPGP
jgi:isopentenyl diphosphate isomerase/L-lactate dehydrogenase-like FMN-dependent dehydrogenase